jgi:8-oxo-dGTP pyrophosphatase MutT (NUDIX family)
MDIGFIHKIEKRILEDLPGEPFQNKMAPINTDKYRIVPEKHKKAGVLALLYPEDNHWHLCYIKRSSKNKDDKHSGQISFPGGKFEKKDLNMQNCAIRETYEEIGINPSKISVLGALTPLYVYASNFLVYPFVGFTEMKPKFILQESEVADIITLPINFITDDSNKTKSQIIVRNNILDNVPHYKLTGEIIWGATAMITSELEKIVKDVS